MKINFELLERIREIKSLFYLEPTDQEIKTRYSRLNIQETIYPITINEVIVFKSKF
jgi:hypothetical protein